MKRIVLNVLKAPVLLYRYILSPLIGPKCRFYPSCSAYLLEALETHGVMKGLFLGVRRILKCHPWCRTHWHDPVPKRFTWGDIFGYKRRQNPHPRNR